jgi:hypothetical protein
LNFLKLLRILFYSMYCVQSFTRTGTHYFPLLTICPPNLGYTLAGSNQKVYCADFVRQKKRGAEDVIFSSYCRRNPALFFNYRYIPVQYLYSANVRVRTISHETFSFKHGPNFIVIQYSMVFFCEKTCVLRYFFLRIFMN